MRACVFVCVKSYKRCNSLSCICEQLCCMELYKKNNNRSKLNKNIVERLEYSY